MEGCKSPAHTKKGKKCLPQNYRPIAIVSLLSKIMEFSINLQIVKYLKKNRILSDNQYGFRRCRSTGDLLTYVMHVWTNTIEKYGGVSGGRIRYF